MLSHFTGPFHALSHHGHRDIVFTGTAGQPPLAGIPSIPGDGPPDSDQV